MRFFIILLPLLFSFPIFSQQYNLSLGNVEPKISTTNIPSANLSLGQFSSGELNFSQKYLETLKYQLGGMAAGFLIILGIAGKIYGEDGNDNSSSENKEALTEGEMMIWFVLGSSAGILGHNLGASWGVDSYKKPANKGFSGLAVFGASLLAEAVAVGAFFIMDYYTENTAVAASAFAVTFIFLPPLFSVVAGDITERERGSFVFNVLPPQFAFTNDKVISKKNLSIFPINLAVNF